VSTFNTFRIDSFRERLKQFSRESGILYLFEPSQNSAPMIDLHNEELIRQIRRTFRSFSGRSAAQYELLNVTESYSILNAPKAEVRCFSNGIVEVFISPIVKINSLPPGIKQVRFDNIVGNGRQLDEVISLIRDVFKLEVDIDLHLTIFGVQGCYPYSISSMKLRVEPFAANVVAVPVLQIEMGRKTNLQKLLNDHLLNDNSILTDLL